MHVCTHLRKSNEHVPLVCVRHARRPDLIKREIERLKNKRATEAVTKLCEAVPGLANVLDIGVHLQVCMYVGMHARICVMYLYVCVSI
jgi:hypothetical protein